MNRLRKLFHLLVLSAFLTIVGAACSSTVADSAEDHPEDCEKEKCEHKDHKAKADASMDEAHGEAKASSCCKDKEEMAEGGSCCKTAKAEHECGDECDKEGCTHHTHKGTDTKASSEETTEETAEEG